MCTAVLLSTVFLTHFLSHPFSKSFGFGRKLDPAFMVVRLIVAAMLNIAPILRSVSELCFTFLICIQRDVVSLCPRSPPLLLSCADLLSIRDVNYNRGHLIMNCTQQLLVNIRRCDLTQFTRLRSKRVSRAGSCRISFILAVWRQVLSRTAL